MTRALTNPEADQRIEATRDYTVNSQATVGDPCFFLSDCLYIDLRNIVFSLCCLVQRRKVDVGKHEVGEDLCPLSSRVKTVQKVEGTSWEKSQGTGRN